MATDSYTLARRMGPFALIVYGVGDMVGSGIYGTIGEAAASLGNAVWLAFVGSMVAAMFTGLSYASLASRYPRAAGAAYITQRAYRFTFLAYVVGLAVTASGLTSMATNSNVFATFLAGFLAPIPGLGALPAWAFLLVFIGLMTLINLWGIRESMWVNLLCTVIEVGGLIFVIAVGMRYWGSVEYLRTPGAAEAGAHLDLMLVGSGAVLTFFAFVGFEDMLNVAEEVREPERTMPWGMVTAISITAVLYLATAITAVSVVDYHQLGDAALGAPLAQVTDTAAPWLPGWVFEVITLFAAANTVLINYIMSSRMLYGMSRQGLLPEPLGRVLPKRRTPHWAIVTLMAIILLLAFVGDISQLARATSLLLLSVFCIINLALVILKGRHDEPKGKFEVPTFIPVLGVLCCAGLVGVEVVQMEHSADGWMPLAVAAGLLLFISFLYFVTRPAGGPKPVV